MQNLPGNPVPSHVQTEAQLSRAIDICKKFINASKCSSISMLLVVTEAGKQHHEILSFGQQDQLPVPKEMLFNFFYELSQTLTEQRLQLLTQNVEQ